jgi:hypothetical protein
VAIWKFCLLLYLQVVICTVMSRYDYYTGSCFEPKTLVASVVLTTSSTTV